MHVPELQKRQKESLRAISIFKEIKKKKFINFLILYLLKKEKMLRVYDVVLYI